MEVITREKRMVNTIYGGRVPMYAYGIEADNYEEAYEMAKHLFNRDYEMDVEIAMHNLANRMMQIM